MDPLSRRIEQLAALATEDNDADQAADPGLVANVAALRLELGAVRADLAALRTEVGGVRDEVEEVGGTLSSSVSAGRTESGSLGRRLAELGARLEVVSGTVEGVGAALPGLATELREGLAQLSSSARLEEIATDLRDTVQSRVDDVAGQVRRTLEARLSAEDEAAASSAAALVDARGVIEARLAVLEDALDALSERIESLARDGASTTTDKLRELGVAVGALEAGIDARIEQVAAEQTDSVVTRLAEVHDARLTELSTLLADTLRTRTDQLRREVVEVLGRGAAETVGTRAAVTELAETVRSTMDGFATTMDRDLKGLVTAVTTALAEGREEAQTELDDIAEKLLETVTSLQTDLTGRAAATAAQLTTLHSAVEGEIGSMRPHLEQLVTASTTTVEGFATLRSDLADTVEALRVVVLATLAETRAETRDIRRNESRFVWNLRVGQAHRK